MLEDLINDHWYDYCLGSGYPYNELTTGKFFQAIDVVKSVIAAYLDKVDVGVDTPRYSYAVVTEGEDFIDLTLFFED